MGISELQPPFSQGNTIPYILGNKPVQENSRSSQPRPSHPLHGTLDIDLAFPSGFTLTFHTHLFHLLLKVSVVVVRNHLCKSNLFRSGLKKLKAERARG